MMNILRKFYSKKNFQLKNRLEKNTLTYESEILFLQGIWVGLIQAITLRGGFFRHFQT